ncbi:MAG TPA: segregation/condensation protein A [Anaerolineales bacterium]|nr:segregation/condensation protein A [Anaerolineales bacterium]
MPIYEGPLDLLLDLIERAELDITSVSLAVVTDQYLGYMHSLEQSNADDISSFLIIAARLLQIKSEALLPRPPQREPGEEDVGASLVEQLRLYKRIKEVGLWLDARQQAGLATYLRVAAPPRIEPKLDPSTLTLEKFMEAANSVFARAADKEPLGSVIAAPTVTIREKIDLIARTLRQLRRASFRGLLGDKSTRLEVVVTFLALLELIKRYRVQVSQESLFSDIQIDHLEDWGEGEDIELEFE